MQTDNIIPFPKSDDDYINELLKRCSLAVVIGGLSNAHSERGDTDAIGPFDSLDAAMKWAMDNLTVKYGEDIVVLPLCGKDDYAN